MLCNYSVPCPLSSVLRTSCGVECASTPVTPTISYCQQIQIRTAQDPVGFMSLSRVANVDWFAQPAFREFSTPPVAVPHALPFRPQPMLVQQISKIMPVILVHHSSFIIRSTESGDLSDESSSGGVCSRVPNPEIGA
jgi:hypothetical protein